MNLYRNKLVIAFKCTEMRDASREPKLKMLQFCDLFHNDVEMLNGLVIA